MLTLYGDEHSEGEERWITVGLDHRGMLLTVCHTYEQDTEQTARIRIISARKATPKEARQYREM
jgi:uncharacterized DUF497 family protein